MSVLALASAQSVAASSGFDGASVDGNWYLDVTGFAKHTAWLNGVGGFYANYGLLLFAVLAVFGWWRARGADAKAMAAVVLTALSVGVAAVLNVGIKAVVQEPRPCIAYPKAFTLEHCPGATDYAFPSNHSVIAAAAATGLVLVGRALAIRWLGAVAVAAALLMAASRVYVGVHYPHDVIAGLLLGTLVALLVFRVFGGLVLSLVTRLRWTSLRPLVVAKSSSGTGADARPKSAGNGGPALHEDLPRAG